ncbi:DUF3741-associated sequence motif [Sesbania bispinosa]|nr:DUF3741-associated sequence motif [Sesbania bispinosa]
MYKSFVTCDDPKGVVQCGTIRKYRRTYSQKMKDKIKIQKTPENIETSLMNTRYKEGKILKGSSENLTDPSSLHLIQVSRGDQSLNSMIDSWSSNFMYDGRSKDTAKSLLKGVLNMQDSLIMLSKLQEASQHTARSKRKHTEKPKRDKIDAKMIGRMHANQFSEQSNPKRYQRAQPSADDGSSSKLIKESLIRQNLFPFPNTTPISPSQSSGVSTHRFADPSFSLTPSKGPNLVAKLMGLEEVPSKSFPAIMQKPLDGEKIMLKVKRNKYRAEIEKVNPEQKVLRETSDTVHLKGQNFVKEPKLLVHHFSDPNSKQFDNLSPIVLMKPQCTSCQESVKTHIPVPPEELSIRKLREEIISSKTIRQRKGSSSSSTNMDKEMEKDVRRRLTKEKRPEFLKEVVKLDAKGINPMEKTSGKLKLYCQVSHTSQANETIDKKCKVQIISRKLPEKDISVPRIVAIPQDQREITSTKLRKPPNWSRVDKNEIFFLESTDSNTIFISKKESQKITNSKDLSMEIKESDSVLNSLTRRKNQLKNQTPSAEPEAAKSIAEQMGLGKEKKSIGVPGKDDSAEIRITTVQADELMMRREALAYENKNRGCKRRKSSSGNDIMLLKSEHENDSIFVKEAPDSIPDKEGDKLKHFLLTSESFIRHAEKLFNLDVDCPKILQKNETKGIDNLRLYLECANELSECKSLQESQVVRSLLLTCVGNSRLLVSLRRLVEEIYDAIENLKFYSESCGEKPFTDNLFAMTERDIMCNGLVNGIWEWGWRHGFSADETEMVVNKVESLLVSELIEDIIINL